MKRVAVLITLLCLSSFCSAQVLQRLWEGRKYINSQTDTSIISYIPTGQVVLALSAKDSISATVYVDYSSGSANLWETASYPVVSTANTGLRWHRVLRSSYGGTGLDSTCIFGATQIRVRIVYASSGNGVTNDTLWSELVHE